MRILVAEDDTAFRSMIATSLARDGHDVKTACDGRELVRTLSAPLAEPIERAFDLVISDVRMPGGSGLEVLARVHKTNPHVRFVIITAFGDEALHAEATRLGALAVLDKPFDLAVLRSLVAAFAAGRPITAVGSG